MRLAPLKKADLDVEQSALYQALVTKSVGRAESFVLDDTGAVRGPFAVLLRHPATGRPLQELATVLRFEGTLSDQAREVVILTVAAFWGAEHEWSRHVEIARTAGVPEAAFLAIRDGRSFGFDVPETHVSYEAAREIVHSHDLSDEVFVRAHEVLGEKRLAEVTVLAGYYSLLSMQLRVFRVGVPDSADDLKGPQA